MPAERVDAREQMLLGDLAGVLDHNHRTGYRYGPSKYGLHIRLVVSKCYTMQAMLTVAHICHIRLEQEGSCEPLSINEVSALPYIE